MMIVTEAYKVYKFDELEEDIQDKAVEKYYNINVDHDWWDGDYHLGLSSDEMKARRIPISDRWWESDKPKDSQGNIIGEYPAHTGLFRYKKMYFDLGQSSYIQFPDLEVTDDDVFRKFLRVSKRLWDNCSYYWERSGGYYSFEGTTRLVIEPDFRCDHPTGEFTQRQQGIVDRAIEIMNDRIDDALSILRDEYEVRTGREAIIETLKANDYDFTEEGEIA